MLNEMTPTERTRVQTSVSDALQIPNRAEGPRQRKNSAFVELIGLDWIEMRDTLSLAITLESHFSGTGVIAYQCDAAQIARVSGVTENGCAIALRLLGGWGNGVAEPKQIPAALFAHDDWQEEQAA